MNSSDSELDESPSLPCGICGEEHDLSGCELIQVNHYVEDTKVQSRARLTLPSNLKIETMAEGSCSIVALEDIKQGTRFGPFEAKKLFTIEPGISFPLKIFQSKDYFKEYYLDTSDENDCNWMCFVQPATNSLEQNFICYEDNSNIYFLSLRDVVSQEHLKVWYAPYYGKLMNKESLFDAEIDYNENNMEDNIDISKLVQNQQRIRDRNLWICKFCGTQETDVLNFASHMIAHYRKQLQKKCELCSESFGSKRSLLKHQDIVHTANIYGNHFSLESSSDNNKIITSNEKQSPETFIGGPLLNQTLPIEKTNALLENIMLENFNLDETSTILADSDNLNLGVDTLMCENENFNFNIEDSNEKFVCDICLRNFSKLKFLIQHLNCHTGIYTCTNCKKVFSRKENLTAHSCTNTKIKCDYCDLKFTLKKNLTKHVATKHNIKFICNKECKKVFTSSKTLEEHKCLPVQVVLNCSKCDKKFFNSKNLNRHLKVHYAQTLKENQQFTHLCEICSKSCQSKKLLDQHMVSHKESQFTCQTCQKTFKRRKTLEDHMKIHKNNLSHACATCDKKFALKKYLDIHMATHRGEILFDCSECSQQFRTKANVKLHFNRKHEKKCKVCDVIFESTEKLKQHIPIHYEKCYECPLCKHIVKLRSSLARHLKNKHPDETIDITNFKALERQINKENTKISNNNVPSKDIKEVSNSEVIEDLLNYKDKEDTNTMQEIANNLDYLVESYDESNLIDSNFNMRSNSKNFDEAVMDFNSIELDFEKNLNNHHSMELNNTEVNLSMPVLGDIDQSIALDGNTYLLENGSFMPAAESVKTVFLCLVDPDQSKSYS